MGDDTNLSIRDRHDDYGLRLGGGFGGIFPSSSLLVINAPSQLH